MIAINIKVQTPNQCQITNIKEQQREATFYLIPLVRSCAPNLIALAIEY